MSFLPESEPTDFIPQEGTAVPEGENNGNSQG